MVAMNPNIPAALEEPSAYLDTEIMETMKKIIAAVTHLMKSIRGQRKPLNLSLNLVEYANNRKRAAKNSSRGTVTKATAADAAKHTKDTKDRATSPMSSMPFLEVANSLLGRMESRTVCCGGPDSGASMSPMLDKEVSFKLQMGQTSRNVTDSEQNKRRGGKKE